MRSQVLQKTMIALYILVLAISIPAASTKVFEEESFSDFEKGEVKTTSLSSEGEIFPAPARQTDWESEDELLWRIVQGPGGIIYFSTGNEGKIYRRDAKGKTELWCDLEEVAAFSLAVDKNSVVYAGASPGGKIYRIPEKNISKVFCETGEEYVWDLVFNSEGDLFAATGNQGKLFKISASGEAELYYEATDKNLMDILFLDKVNDDSIYLASHDKGRIYRVYEKDKAFVLFDSGMDEIRAIVEGEEGYLYAALNTAKSLPPPPPKPPDKNEDNANTENGNKNKEAPKLALPMIMGERSSIIKIDIAGYVWPVLNMPESPIHSLLYDQDAQNVLASAGEKGKLYRIEDLNKYTLVFSTEEKYILSLLSSDQGFYFGTGQSAKLYSVDWKDRKEGEYISPVHNAETSVQWGRIRIQSDIPGGTSVKIQTRSGNTEEPDKTWSEWTKEEEIKNEQALISCPVARFYQYKLNLSGRDAKTYPLVKKVESYYAPPNRAPIIENLEVASPTKKKRPPKPPTKPKPGKNSKNNSQGSNPASAIDAKANSNPKKVKITWKVTDPEDDQLRYSLFFKGEKETVWKKIEDKLEKNTYEFSTDALPDGRYRIKLIASDIPTNPKNSAKESEHISDIFTVDNTPPKLVKKLSFDRVEKEAVVIHAVAEDDTSIISTAQYSLNAEEWLRVNPEDEIFDSRTESFSFLVNQLEEEEILVTIMVTDAEGNTVVCKLLITLD